MAKRRRCEQAILNHLLTVPAAVLPTETLTAIFDVHVAFRDPGIVPMFGGMFNALLGFGDCFLEIVSPTDEGYEQDSTSAKLLRKSGGDCGYMAIVQVPDSYGGGHYYT